jgi:hypothetical protein
MQGLRCKDWPVQPKASTREWLVPPPPSARECRDPCSSLFWAGTRGWSKKFWDRRHRSRKRAAPALDSSSARPRSTRAPSSRLSRDHKLPAVSEKKCNIVAGEAVIEYQHNRKGASIVVAHAQLFPALRCSSRSGSKSASFRLENCVFITAG